MKKNFNDVEEFLTNDFVKFKNACEGATDLVWLPLPDEDGEDIYIFWEPSGFGFYCDSESWGGISEDDVEEIIRCVFDGKHPFA